MSFFEDLGKKLSFVMGETVSKTKEIAGVTKLNTSISARQHEIEDAYREIGRKLYERECNDPDSPVAALCAKVAANLESIQDLKNETVENRKARSEAIFGAEAETKEEPSEQNAETVTEEAAQEAAEAVAESVEPVVEAAEAMEAAAEAAEAAEKAVEAAAEAEAAEPTDNAQ